MDSLIVIGATGLAVVAIAFIMKSDTKESKRRSSTRSNSTYGRESADSLVDKFVTRYSKTSSNSSKSTPSSKSARSKKFKPKVYSV